MTLDIVIYRAGSSWARVFEDALEAGIKRHGVIPEIRKRHDKRPADLGIIWAHKETELFEMQRAHRADYMVMERGFIGDRHKMTSLGYNGLNGRAEFHAHDMPGDRWHKHFGDSWLKLWKTSGEYILIMGQVPGDASVQHVNINQWASNMAKLCKLLYPNVPVRFRPHPKRPVNKIAEISSISDTSLEEDLTNAVLVVTYSSNSGVNALLAGVPVVATDPGSMVYNMAAHNVTEPIIRPDRTQWAYNMAYCQWTEEEIANGDAWEHLKQRYQ